jgi:hypothetical protein
MKNVLLYIVAVILLLFLNSCGVNGSLILNHNQNATQVHLAEKNFKVLDQVSGSADVSYVLLFGGAWRTKLYNNAYAEMINNANLVSGSKAVTNIVTEEHVGGVPPFYFKRTITVTGQVIEFTR